MPTSSIARPCDLPMVESSLLPYPATEMVWDGLDVWGELCAAVRVLHHQVHLSLVCFVVDRLLRDVLEASRARSGRRSFHHRTQTGISNCFPHWLLSSPV
jgi:hypothetical protein